MAKKWSHTRLKKKLFFFFNKWAKRHFVCLLLKLTARAKRLVVQVAFFTQMLLLDPIRIRLFDPTETTFSGRRFRRFLRVFDPHLKPKWPMALIWLKMVPKNTKPFSVKKQLKNSVLRPIYAPKIIQKNTYKICIKHVWTPNASKKMICMC